MSAKIDRLITLNSRLEDVIEFRRYDDRDSAGSVATGVGAGIGAGAGVAGGVMAHKAIMSKYGKRLSIGPGPQASQPGAGGFVMGAGPATEARTSEAGIGGAYRQAATDIGGGIKQRFTGGYTVGKQAYETVGRRGGSTVEQIIAGLRKGAKYATRFGK